MEKFEGFTRGIGLGGWLTNFKRLKFIPKEWHAEITKGDIKHFESFITENDVRQIASWGLDHIRLPFNYNVIEDEASPLVYKETGFKYLDRGIAWAEKHGLNTLLDLHMAAGASCDYESEKHLMENDELQNRFISLWKAVAERYKNKGAQLAFELLNEINTPHYDKWNELAAKTVAVIRQISPGRVIVVGCVCWNTPPGLNYLTPPDDPNVVCNFHFYDPFIFTHQKGLQNPRIAAFNQYIAWPSDMEPYNDWAAYNGGDGGVSDPGLGRVDQAYMRKILGPVYDFKARHPGGILYCGEFGVIRHCDMTSRENYYRDFIALLGEAGIPYAAWNYLSAPYDSNRFSVVDDWDRKPLSGELISVIAGVSPRQSGGGAGFSSPRS